MAKVHQDVEGFKLPSFFSRENIRMVFEYKPRQGDHFVVDYPKCGSNWMQYILYLIFHDGQPPKNGIEFGKASMFVDLMGMEGVEGMPRPIIFKSHITYDKFPKSPEAKYIYICRNPKDCVVSFYHMLLGLDKEHDAASFAKFFDNFMAGGESYGDYFDHVLSWYNHRHEPNVLFLHYEEMKEDHRGSVMKIARFLGPEYETKLTESPEMLDNVVKYSSVEYMKNAKSAAQEFVSSPDPDAILNDPTVPKGLKRYLISSKENNRVFKIVRKGIVGDWRSHFTPEQSRLMDERIEERLGDTDIPQMWKRLGCV